MKCYAAHGVTDFVLCLGYKGWLIREFFLNYGAMTTDVTVALGEHGRLQFHGQHAEADWRVTLAETGESTMTGGRLAAIRRYVEDDDIFLLTYGDGVSDVDIRQTVAFHRRHGRVATVTAVRPQGRFGEMRLQDDLVTEFNEKPQAAEGFISGGFFVLDAKRIWDFVGPDSDTAFEREPLQALAREEQLVAYRHTGFWQPMDTAREYLLLNEMWASGNAPWKIW